MQLMAEKGMLKRDETQRSHVYSAALDEGLTEQSLVRSFIDRVLDGSTRKMVLHALAGTEVSDEELAEIKRIIRQLETRK
jgi:predicted transcriptional regulator